MVSNRKSKIREEDVSASADDNSTNGSGKETLSVIPLKRTVVFPYTICSLSVDDPEVIALIDKAVEGSRMAAFVPLRKESRKSGSPDKNDFHDKGTAGRIVKRLRLPDGSRRILVRGLRRIEMGRVVRKKPHLQAVFKDLVPAPDDSMETEALARNIYNLVQNVLGLSPSLPEELNVALYNIEDYGRLADFVADAVNLSYEEKLQVLDAIELKPRLEKIVNFLSREAMVLSIGSEIQEKVNNVLSKSQREHVLREQMRAIQQQLNEPEDTPETLELRERLEKAKLTQEARQAVEREIERLRQMHPYAAEYNVSRNYIDWILSLPWCSCSRDRLNLQAAVRQLDRDHYNLAEAKKRILEFLAVMQLRGDLGRAPILCFVGPPGVGKTSLGQSIADTLRRRFVRISLGGIRDEAEIRGHRRTYVGSMPGRIIQGLRRAETSNPVFMLDEIDKLGRDFRGDPSAALLEILDPAQNTSFSDHYLEIPFDLSRVMFLTTANVIDPIPSALRDRMEIIRIPGYTLEEKVEIGKKFLLPRQIKENGLDSRKVRFNKPALAKIVSLYTREAGVRNLERMLAKICRRRARDLVDQTDISRQIWRVTETRISEILGAPQVFSEKILSEPQVGLVNGLAWTESGGEILGVEACLTAGKGELTLTGSLGEVMKESARIALSYVKSQSAKMNIMMEQLSQKDIHIHVPAGATPKDGPSAGLAMAAALASLLTGRAVAPSVAMTGELSLRGRVRPVGGIKEKVLAAMRGGVKTVLLPAEMQALAEEEIPEEVKKSLTVCYVNNAIEAFEKLDITFPDTTPSGGG